MTALDGDVPRATEAAAGLTTAEARRRLSEDGPNSTAVVPTPAWRRALAKFWAPVPILLELAVVLQLALGEAPEAAVVGVLLLFNVGLGFFQENRAQATLEALKQRLAMTASVRREG